MNRLPKSLVYILAFLVIFVFGWESASYYILKKQAETNVVMKQEDVSPVAALSSFPNNLIASLLWFCIK